MLTLATTETLRGKAGTGSVITFTVSGDAKGTSDAFQTLAQGQLGTSAATPLYTVPASTQALVGNIHLANTSASPVTGVVIYIGGTAGTNQIWSGTIPANGTATYTNDGWKVYDSAGVQQYVGSIGPTGSTGSIGSTGPTGPTGATGVITTLNTTAPLTGGGSASTLTLAIAAATTAAAGSQSAADKLKTDNLWLDVTANSIATLVGDDSTLNDTAMASIIAAAASGATIYFPPGTYRFASEININVDHRLKFVGSGKYTSIIKTTSATANIFHVSVTAWYMHWADLGFQTSVNKTAGYCLLVDAGSNIAMNVYRCAFGDNPAATIFGGINFTGAQSGNVSVLFDLEMSGFSNGGRGIFINGSTINIQIHQTTIGMASTTTSACLEIQQSGAVQVTNFDWIQGTNVVLFNSTAGAGPQACYFTNGFFDQPSGSVIKFMGGNTANRIKFTAVGIAPTGNNHAIEIAGTGAGAVGTTTALPGGISVVDCDIYSSNGTNTGAGIFLNGCQDINIQSCRITGFGGAGGAGVRIAGSSSNQTKVRINGCIFGPNSNLTVNNTTHVDIQAGVSGLGALSVSDNQMDGATTAPLADASASVIGVQKRFSQNSGLMAGAGTLQLLSSAGAAVIAGRGAVTSGTTDTFLFTSKIPASSVQIGQKFRLTAKTQASAAGVPTFNVHLGAAGTIAGDGIVGIVTNTAQVANAYQSVEFIVEVVALGATATLVAHGFSVGGNTAAVGGAVGVQTAAAETIPNVPTTAAWFITFSAACGTTGTLTVKDALLEAL